MAKVQRISATQAKNNFSEILDRVTYYGETFIIERHNKPIATIAVPEETTTNPGLVFLKKLAETSIKSPNVPLDAATNLDKYTWDE